MDKKSTMQIRTLMFGWEFPPIVSGGLGTACFGLTQAMSKLDHTEITFLVPRALKQNHKNLSIVSAHETPISLAESKKHISRYIEIESNIYPYTTTEEFWEKSKTIPGNKLIETHKNGTIPFKGGYGFNLLEEVFKFSIVANELAQNEPFNIIHAHDWLPFPAAIAAKQQSKKPLIVHVHSTEFDRNKTNVNAQVYSIEKEGMDKADAIISVSDYTQKTIIEKYHISPSKIFTIHNGVLRHSPDKKSFYKKDFKEQLVTFMGRITAQKGPQYVLDAAYKVLKKEDNVRFVMAGKGDLLKEMIEKAASLNITDRFHFTGFIDDQQVYDLFSISDAFVLPSISEPFGIAALEAMQWGVPVIASNRSGVLEVVDNMIEYTYNDSDDLANAIMNLLQDIKLQQKLRIEGKKEANKLTWDEPARKVRALYENLLS